jgi:hypothetical protein
VSGWNPKPSYVSGAFLKVPVRATEAQKAAWELAAKKHGMASAGAFLAFAADVYVALSRAYFDTVQEHEDALEGPGGADRRRRERAARQEEEGER